MATHNIILDCDPGVDDALAILLALASPEDITLTAITTVAGNVPLELTQYNARRICTLAGRTDIPIYAGCSRPLIENIGQHTSVHGKDGLGEATLPEPIVALQQQHAVDYIIQAVGEAPGEITLCPIGPLTNIALAIVKQPDIIGKIKQIVFMGGAAFCPGNVTPMAEFNIHVDPWAARIVLSAGIPQVMFGLDVTHQAKTNAAWLAELERSGPVPAAASAMMRRYGTGDPCLHDPCVIAWLIDPSLFDGVDGRISVNCQDDAWRGHTLVAATERHLRGQQPDTHVITRIDNPRFLALLDERLRRF